MKYTPKSFSIPELKGISKTTIDEHIKLYEGYINHLNLVLENISSLKEDPSEAYARSEVQRRLSFEFDGMRNHEYYFSALEKGPNPFSDGDLKKMIESQWDSVENWLSHFKTLAKTRGIGWAMLYYDSENKSLINSWVDEQHLGHLTGLSPIIALDMWEHSFVADYLPSGKGKYIDDFFENLNWNVIEENFSKAVEK